jgi:ubiquinone biosynthesis protein
MTEDILFIFRTLAILFWEYMCFKLGRHPDECVQNVAESLGQLNIFYVKVFQSLSTNAHLLSHHQLEYLSRYTDNVPFGPEDIDMEFLDHIGKINQLVPDNQLIVTNNQLPIKSGLIALVYMGELNGEKVVIKVTRRDIRKRLKSALERIDFMMRIAGSFPSISELNIGDIISENKEIMMAQTDFANEVRNIQRMRKNCRNTDYLVIPEVYPEYTEEYGGMIVMEYIDGVRLEEVLDEDKDDYCLLLAKFGLKSMLFNRFYHGDLHPGNILFLKDTRGMKKIGILDYGVMAELTRGEQDHFYRFFTYLISEDTYREAIIVIRDAFIEPKETLALMEDTDREALTEALYAISVNVLKNQNNFQPTDIYDINKLLYDHGLRLAKCFCKIELAIAISDSVCSKLSLKTSYIDHIRQTAAEMLQATNMEL